MNLFFKVLLGCVLAYLCFIVSIHALVYHGEGEEVQNNPSPPLPAGFLSVSTYNIQQRPTNEALLHLLTRKHSERSYISTVLLPSYMKSEVVCFNEVFTPSLRTELIRNMTRNGYTNYYTADTGLFDSGLIVFSKHSISKRAHHTFRSSVSVDSLARKGVLYVETKGIHVFCTHLNATYTPNDNGKMARRSQLRETRKFIDTRGIPQNEMVVVCGDMNIDYGTQEYDDMLQILGVVETDTTGEASTDYTRNLLVEWGHKERLDYVFYSRNHKRPTSAKSSVDNKIKVKDGVYRGQDLSDHFPIHAYFIF